MQILGSKNGTIKKSGEMQFKKRAGEDPVNTEDTLLTRERLESKMQEIAKGSLEEKIKEQQKVAELEQKAQEKFREWLKIPHEKEFINEEVVLDHHAIIRVFYYYEVPSSSLLILDEEKEGYLRIFPIAKVVASNSPKVNVGDIVNIPAAMAKNILSEQYTQWEQQTTEQPSLKRKFPKPPMYVGRLNEWSQYMYQVNPFTDTSMDDQHTFCIPDRYLQTRKK